METCSQNIEKVDTKKTIKSKKKTIKNKTEKNKIKKYKCLKEILEETNSEKNQNVSINDESINSRKLSKNSDSTESTESDLNNESFLNEKRNETGFNFNEPQPKKLQEETLFHNLSNYFGCCEQFLRNNEKNNINYNTSKNFVSKLTYINDNENEDYCFQSLTDWNYKKNNQNFLTFPEILINRTKKSKFDDYNDNNFYDYCGEMKNFDFYGKKKCNFFIRRRGDWICEICKNLNFRFRDTCNRCKNKKQ